MSGPEEFGGYTDAGTGEEIGGMSTEDQEDEMSYSPEETEFVGPRLPEEMPVLSKEEIDQLVNDADQVLEDFNVAMENLNAVRRLYPGVYELMVERYPEFEDYYEAAIIDLHRIIRMANYYDGQELNQLVDSYNYYARTLNGYFQRLDLEQQEGVQSSLVSALDENNFEDFEEILSDEEKEEVRQFAMDLWNEVFPRTGTENFVMWATGRGGRQELRQGADPSEPLEDWQRIAIAPMVGFERGIRAIGSMANPSNWVTAYESLRNYFSMSDEEWTAIFDSLEYLWEETSQTDKISSAVSLIFSLFMIGTAMGTVSRATRLPAPLAAFQATYMSAMRLRAAPLGVIGGLSLPYIQI